MVAFEVACRFISRREWQDNEDGMRLSVYHEFVVGVNKTFRPMTDDQEIGRTFLAAN